MTTDQKQPTPQEVADMTNWIINGGYYDYGSAPVSSDPVVRIAQRAACAHENGSGLVDQHGNGEFHGDTQKYGRGL